MERTGLSEPTVWRWQARSAEAGVGGLLLDGARPLGKKLLPHATVRQVMTKSAS
jgi:hypothetical protein